MQFGRTISRAVARLRAVLHDLARIDRHIDDLKILQGRALAAANNERGMLDLRQCEFKVFSQWGEDGIIQRLIDLVPIANQSFIEFGVEDFSESNCRFLMMKDNWSGFVIDGSERNIEKIQSAYYYWRYDLQAKRAFISQDNIDQLLEHSGFDSDLGILSVDIDGVDYFVLQAIKSYRPRILVIEYNSVFGGARKITVPYDPAFRREQKHFSHLYFGASLGAFDSLATSMGYSLVGTTSEGVNAFFVRDDVLPPTLAKLDYRQGYVASKFRESRDANGVANFLSGEARIEAIRGLPVYNVETSELESL